MKKMRTKLFVLLLLTSYLLAACNMTLPAGVDVKPGANGSAQVEFAGTVDAINGDQWTVNGQTFKVSGQTQFAANFKVGDTVKVSAEVGADGAVTAREVQVFVGAGQSQTQTQDQSQFQDGTATPEPLQSQTQDQTPTQTQAGASSPEFVGAVESINGSQWVIGGQTFIVTNTTEFKDQLVVGDLVKVHVIVNPDGTFSIFEIEKAVAGSIPGWDDNSNNGNSNDDNSNDSNSNGNSNDDNSNNGNSNDDNGQNNDRNDDNGNANNDDNSGGNSNGGSDDKGSDDNDDSNGGGSDDSGSDDKGGSDNG